jgi:hypothetical protein
MDEIDHDGVQEPNQDVQDWKEDEFSNLIGEWNLLNVSLGIRIFILNSIGKKIILDSHWFMKDEEVID